VLGWLVSKLSFANVVSCVALFVALGGIAYALEDNSVASRHIIDGQVRSVDIQDDGVTSVDVHTLRGRDLGPGVRFNADLASIPAHSCTVRELTFSEVGWDGTNLVVVNPTVPLQPQYTGTALTVSGLPVNSGVRLRVCNLLSSAVDPPSQGFVALSFRL
jgi:hypothetical protein